MSINSAESTHLYDSSELVLLEVIWDGASWGQAGLHSCGWLWRPGLLVGRLLLLSPLYVLINLLPVSSVLLGRCAA